MVLKPFALRIGSRSTLFLKIFVHVFSALPLLWVWWAVWRGLLGYDPSQALSHYLGKGAIHLLFLTLCVSPLSKILSKKVQGAGYLIRLRRPLGLWCFTWASCHFYAWIAYYLLFDWAFVGEEIVKRKYILLGFAAWMILLALAITSIPKIVRKMGRKWKKLHNWIYAVALMAPIHYWWSVKSGFIEPLIYLIIALLLLSFRRQLLLKPLRQLNAPKAS